MATMPTQSPTSAWSLLVTAIAPLSLDTGHTLMAQLREAWNRALAGPGYLYAREIGSSATVEVTTWTP